MAVGFDNDPEEKLRFTGKGPQLTQIASIREPELEHPAKNCCSMRPADQ